MPHFYLYEMGVDARGFRRIMDITQEDIRIPADAPTRSLSTRYRIMQNMKK